MPMTKALEGIVAQLKEQEYIIQEAQVRAKTISEEFANHVEHLDKETSLAILKQLPSGYHARVAMTNHLCLQFGMSQNEVLLLASGLPVV